MSARSRSPRGRANARVPESHLSNGAAPLRSAQRLCASRMCDSIAPVGSDGSSGYCYNACKAVDHVLSGVVGKLHSCECQRQRPTTPRKLVRWPQSPW